MYCYPDGAYYFNYLINCQTVLLCCFILPRLKTVDVLIHSLEEAESQVRKYESRLSEEDIVPADTTAIHQLRDQLKVREEWYILSLLLYCSFCQMYVFFTVMFSGGPSLLHMLMLLFLSPQKWQTELEEQEGVFQSLQLEVGRAKEAGSQLSRLHPDRSPELERYQERANQITERWNGIKRQMETR